MGSWGLGCVLLLAACATTAPVSPAPESPADGLAALNGSRWTWLGAECSDGKLPLAAEGYESDLAVRQTQDGLSLLFDNAVPVRGCTETAVWRASQLLDGPGWAFRPEARVWLPPEGICGAPLPDAMQGELQVSGDLLEVVVHRSPWCRGYDVRFSYLRALQLPAADERRLISHYAAHFNRRDPQAIAAMFAEHGALVEPFSESVDGNHTRHEGREQVRLWYVEAFADPSWLALRLLRIERLGDSGHYMAVWEYVDDKLEAPVLGRNLFVIAGGEIYETEVQLLSLARPRFP